MTLAVLGVALVVGLGAPDNPAEPARPAPFLLVGTVLDPDRRPAPDVEILYSTRRPGVGWGRVAARTRTDAQGRYHLKFAGPPAAPEPGMLWAYRPGNLVASRPITVDIPARGQPLDLVLDVSARAVFVVRGPNGQPVAGARIQPRVLQRDFGSVPDGLAEEIEAHAVTDASGRAVITAFFAEEIATAIVSAPGLGRQQFSFRFGAMPAGQGPKLIDLSPVGRVEGRVIADAGQAPLARRLGVYMHDPSDSPPARAILSVDVDANGRFALDEVPAGQLSISGEAPAGSPWFLSSAIGVEVRPGQTTHVEVRRFKGVRLHGLARERKTHRPVPGLLVGMYGSPIVVQTDEQGEFTFYCRSGQRGLLIGPVPPSFAPIPYGTYSPRVPEKVPALDLAPVYLDRAGTVRGIVVDDQGAPVSGASVLARCPGYGSRRAISGEDGAFRFEAVSLLGPVQVSAEAPDGRRTRRPVQADAGAGPVRVELETGLSTSLAGRVLDARGKRIADARVHLRTEHQNDDGHIMGDELVAFRGAYVIRTGNSGWFRTPGVLDPKRWYSALVESDGYEPARTGWVAGTLRNFPDVVLRAEAPVRPPAVVGNVADRGGHPVADASVWTTNESGRPIRTRTDADGRFRLENVPPRRSFLFVEAAGFRFFGKILDPSAGKAESIALTRTSERPVRSMTTLPPPRTRAQERELVTRLLVPYLERVLKEGDSYTTWRILDVLGRAAPRGALKVTDLARPGEIDSLDLVLRACVSGLCEDARDEAIKLIDTIKNVREKAWAHFVVCDAIPPSDRKARIEQLDRALVLALSSPRADDRFLVVAGVVRRLLDLGESDRGTKLLDEFLPAARALPKTEWGGYARGSFGEQLVRIDPDAAIELIAGVGDPPYLDRHRLRVIRNLAVNDLARAEALLNTLENPDLLAHQLARVAHPMARKDPERARRLCDRDLGTGTNATALPFARPYAIGMVALAVADTDKPRALRYLDEAFKTLKPLAARGLRGTSGIEVQSAAAVAAALLPAAERIDPMLVQEYFWRAAALRDPSRPGTANGVAPDAALALLLARYDREAAMVLLAPLLDRRPVAKDATLPTLILAAGAVDPDRAAEMLESVADDPRIELHPLQCFKNIARYRLGEFLTQLPTARWDWLIQDHLYLWTVSGDESFF